MRTPFSNSVRDCVEYILYNFNIARKNDNALILYYWLVCDKLPLLNKYFDGNDPNIKEKLDEIFRATTPETITRARRLIQHEEGKYIDKRTETRRRTLEDIYRKTSKGLQDYF